MHFGNAQVRENSRRGLVNFIALKFLIRFLLCQNRDMLVSESVLRELYPKDLGLESPNPANHYQLMRHNVTNFASLDIGIPYKWAQRMSGLHFIASDVAEQKVSQKFTS